MRRLKTDAVSYGRGTAIFLKPTRRKILFEIKIENSRDQKITPINLESLA